MWIVFVQAVKRKVTQVNTICSVNVPLVKDHYNPSLIKSTPDAVRIGLIQNMNEDVYFRFVTQKWEAIII